MRINGKFHSFEKRIAFQAAQGTLTPGKILMAVAKLDGYTKKLARFAQDSNIDHRSVEALRHKIEALIAIPEIKARVLT